ncbi:MAG: hypothetical protein HOP19_20120 [Acidobacteria bacterium]|nr:hypothetical protein [Acidobacteriota bacterium]
MPQFIILENLCRGAYTIKDGIVYDAKKLLADVEKIVAEAKRGVSSAGQ